MEKITFINWKIFWILFIVSILGIIAVLPYVLSIQSDLLSEIPVSFPIFLLIVIVQSAFLFAIMIIIGLYLAKKIGFHIPLLERWSENKEVRSYFKSILGISIGLGVLAAVLIIAGDYLLSIFGASSLDLHTNIIPIWQGFFASFYGGINEEIVLRLFFMSLLVWVFFKFRKTKEGKPTNFGIWSAIILSAIIFGIGHLPFTASLTMITPIIIARAIILNGIGGIIFGWLYWKKGLESAMISHFSADLVLYAIFPLIPLG